MNRTEATRAAERIFGPNAFAVRVPSYDRDTRFHVLCMDVGPVASAKTPGGRVSEPTATLLGSGGDFASAIEHAKTTPNGQLAIKAAQAGQEFAKKALLSKNELEFADLVEEQTIKEALEAGADDTAVAAIRRKFAKAKEKINESVSRAAEGTDQGTDGSSDRTDHEGGGTEDQRGG